jgi:pimeloyl-ACP methyl ester carboxylesterase
VLDPTVAAALAAPPAAEHLTVQAADTRFHALAWGHPDAPPVVLMHGVTSCARTWWRVGPTVAAAGYRVIAPDLPGHGLTGHWRGHVAFRDTAADLAAFARAAVPGVDPADVRVIGHSWGAMSAAAFPGVGYSPGRLVLVDPPTVPLAMISLMLQDPVEQKYVDLGTALGAVGRLYPTWTYGDVLAKAEGLTQFDEPAVRAILTENGDWDGGLAALADPAALDVPTRLIRGDPAAGGYVPDAALPAFVARLGAEHVTTIAGGLHSPYRTRPEETTLALLKALD